MITVLQQQYAMTKGSRAFVLNFIETEIGADLNTPVPAYENNTICYLLEHVASCYFNWLGYFALKQPVGQLNDTGFNTSVLIRQLYSNVDEVVNAFLENFKDKLEIPITGVHNRNGQLSATPLQLFTHVLTHEFHHKGQIMTMCRLLGHIPPDTDVSRLF